MKKEVREIEPVTTRPLDPTTYRYLSFKAESAVDYLDQAWDRPVRHNRRIERQALFFCFFTRVGCLNLRVQHHELHRPTFGDSEARYEIDAGIRTVPELFPFSDDEHKQFDHSVQRYDEWFFNDSQENGRRGIHDDQPELIDRWHNWLWVDDDSVRGQSPNPAAEVLQVGCRHLAQGLVRLLNDYPRP